MPRAFKDLTERTRLVLVLFRVKKCDGFAGSVPARRAADSMHKILNPRLALGLGEIVDDHVRDVFDIQSPGRDPCGEQGGDP